MFLIKDHVLMLLILIDKGLWYLWALNKLGLNYIHSTFGKRNSIERLKDFIIILMQKKIII
ncbi:MAG: hypothetical protein QXI49_07630 [Candidatus Methanomethylicaceae archaeon]